MQLDMGTELAVLWRRLALLEEHCKAKDAQIDALTNRVIELEQVVKCSSSTVEVKQADLIDVQPKKRARGEVSEGEHVTEIPSHEMPMDEGSIDPYVDLISNSDIDSYDDAVQVDEDEQDRLVRQFSLQPILARMPKSISHKLHRHQRVGCSFLLNILENNSGTLFADALGLGKSLQVLTALYMFWTQRTTCKILVVMPSILLSHWIAEIQKFNSWLLPDEKAFEAPFLIDSPMTTSVRISCLQSWCSSGGLLLLSYGIYKELLDVAAGKAMLCYDPGADVLVLDEGHKICNPKTSSHFCLSLLRTQRRIVVSGYPLQNNLRELYSLVEFANRDKCQRIFKSYRNFQFLFENPIVRNRSQNASKARGRAFVLYDQLRSQQLLFRRDGKLLQRFLAKKTELVISIRLSSVQRQLWMKFLSQRRGLDGIVMHNVATMLADHPQIAYRQASSDPTLPCQEWLSEIGSSPVDIEDSGKMVVLMSLIKQTKAAGEKIVIFSRWIKALSFVEECIASLSESDNHGIRALRLDGSTSMPERKTLIDDFMSKSSDADCFLISTLCGEGISLVAANRVVILDVNWNPSVDFQAAYRVFRIGQTKPVFIYRFVMHDMFEQMVFQRQLEKVEMTNWVLDSSEQDIVNPVDTRWAEFSKEPAAIDTLSGPVSVDISDFARGDQVTSEIIRQHGVGHEKLCPSNSKEWIMSVTELSLLFNDHIEADNFDDVDAVMAREQLEYDQVYPHGTPIRDPVVHNGPNMSNPSSPASNDKVVNTSTLCTDQSRIPVPEVVAQPPVHNRLDWNQNADSLIVLGSCPLSPNSISNDACQQYSINNPLTKSSVLENASNSVLVGLQPTTTDAIAHPEPVQARNSSSPYSVDIDETCWKKAVLLPVPGTPSIRRDVSTTSINFTTDRNQECVKDVNTASLQNYSFSPLPKSGGNGSLHHFYEKPLSNRGFPPHEAAIADLTSLSAANPFSGWHSYRRFDASNHNQSVKPIENFREVTYDGDRCHIASFNRDRDSNHQQHKLQLEAIKMNPDHFHNIAVQRQRVRDEQDRSRAGLLSDSMKYRSDSNANQDRNSHQNHNNQSKRGRNREQVPKQRNAGRSQQQRDREAQRCRGKQRSRDCDSNPDRDHPQARNSGGHAIQNRDSKMPKRQKSRPDPPQNRPRVNPVLPEPLVSEPVPMAPPPPSSSHMTPARMHVRF